MTGTTRSSADLEPRRKRLLYHAWHRGTREMDLLLGRFTDATITTWTDAEVEQMEALMRVPDTELYRWITEQDEVPPNHRSPVLDRVIAFHKGA
ncbi:FAD assembly factor SdhE [Acuticoccus mangrovi]|uniref:FAD assembly factor SdhE n=1 Tax=Acuticoccus mangrovi TaxID=2796142 RepID=A0A934IMN5_9HYPH|nr:succinate dehydrogenase assembly factor 2 [Acuticoccus mangrovi]MBJ3774705.1 succinate dehydrogenase assembly factor 2 [Acuticoccus mangrovi]